MGDKIEVAYLGDGGTDNRYPLKSGENLKKYRVLKLENGKLLGANTGDTPHSILFEDTDATSGDTKCSYYTSGKFDANFLDFGTAGEEEFREAFRVNNITTLEANK